MSYHCQVQNGTARKNLSGWDRAIADAKRRIRELEFAIGVLRRRKKAGEPWPGHAKASTQN